MSLTPPPAPRVLSSLQRPPFRLMSGLIIDVLRRDMIEINQYYSTEHAFAGGRLATFPPARELWAKPLHNGAAVVLFNRGGIAIGQRVAGAPPLPPHCNDPESTLPPCTGCFSQGDQPWTAPCDDNATASSGAQTLTLSTDQLPREWLTSSMQQAREVGAPLVCDVYDIFAAAAKGAPLGRFSEWSATVPPHGVRFLRLANCS